MPAALRRTRAADGFTLVEVLVAMVILSVVLALSTGLVIRALDQNSNVSQQSQAQNRNDTGMEQLTRALRQAVFPTGGNNTNSSIITSATGTQVQFTTRLQSTAVAQATPNTWGTAPVQVTAKLDTASHKLLWGSGAENSPCASVCTYSAPSSWRTMIYGVRNDLGSAVCPKNTDPTGAVFHYWYVDPSGNLAAWSAANPNAPTQTELAKISVVQIDLWTQTQTGPQTPDCVALTDYVNLRNWQ